MSYLITGGCGFIGINLIAHLLKKNSDITVRVLDNLSVGTKENLAQVCSFSEINIFDLTSNNFSPSSQVELVVGDIRDRETCVKVCKGINVVIHLAAHAGVIPSVENPYYDFEVNVLGTLNLLYASVENKVDTFIFASSNAPLGNQKPPMIEQKPAKPMSPYGASKLACEAYCSAFYHSYGLKTISLRFSNAYGPYSLHKNSVIAKFIKDGILKRELTIYGDGTQTRDFIHVEDLCHAIHLLLTPNALPPTSHIPRIWGEVFQLATGRETRIIDLAEMVRELFREEIQIEFKPERKGEIKRSYSDINKAKALLGFEPKISLKDGIKRVYEWFMSQDIETIKNTMALSGSD